MVLEFGLEWLIGTALVILFGFAGMLKLFLSTHLKQEDDRLKSIRYEIKEIKQTVNANQKEIRQDYITRREYESHRRELIRYLKAILQNVRHTD